MERRNTRRIKMNTMKFDDLCTDHQETALTTVSEMVDDMVNTILTKKLGIPNKGYTLSIIIDVHDAPIASTVIRGNPQRVAHNSIMAIKRVIKEDDDYKDLTDLLLGNGRVPARESIHEYLEFAEQFTRLAMVLKGTLDKSQPVGSKAH